MSCEGLGYLVVGAEPGSLAGITSADPAHLDQTIAPWVGGADGPRWTPTYVQVRGVVVLVVAVEAPRPGDRIFTLRKEHERYPKGTVFIRKQGRTAQADDADMDVLQDRLAAGRRPPAALDVCVVGDVPLPWLDFAVAHTAIERWVQGHYDRRLERARNLEGARLSPEPLADLAYPGVRGLAETLERFRQQQERIQATMRGLGYAAEEDKRTLDEYIDELDSWRNELVEHAVLALPRLCIDNGHGNVAVKVQNLGPRFLPDVEVHVRFPFQAAKGYDYKPEQVELRKPPRDYGEPKPVRNPFLQVYPGISASAFGPPMEPIARRTWVEDGSVAVTFAIGDLRPHGVDTSDEIYLLVQARPDDGLLHGTWEATVRDMDGLLTGTLQVPVRAEPLDPVTLLSAAVVQDD